MHTIIQAKFNQSSFSRIDLHTCIFFIFLTCRSHQNGCVLHFNRVFHYKLSILGISTYFWKHPNQLVYVPGNPNGAPGFDWNFGLVLGEKTFKNRGHQRVPGTHSIYSPTDLQSPDGWELQK